MKTKGKSKLLFILCTLFIIAFAIVGFSAFEIFGYRIKSFDEAITKGLDLQGGVSVLMEIQDKEIKEGDLEKTKELINLRVNKLGVAETVVTTEGERRIRVDIPGQYDSKGIVESLTKTGKLTFRAPDEKTIILTGADVENATVVLDPDTGKPIISLKLKEEGKTKFSDATKKYLGQQIGIYMDDDMITNPKVESQITNGEAVITGQRSNEEAQNLAGLINAGALPVTIKAASVKTVGAQLGESALTNAYKAAAVGILLIFVFMIVYYKIPGFIASLALTFFTTLVLLTFAEVGVTLTLPGIAALLLTVGMAVDANILIFERIREELRRGNSIKAALNKGFENATSSIIDSNLTSIIAALILYYLGTGAVKGFAVTLMIGIVISLFTAMIVTKFLMKRGVEMGLLSKPSHFGVKEGGEKHA